MTTPSYTRQFRQRSALSRQISQHHAPKISLGKVASSHSSSCAPASSSSSSSSSSKPMPIPLPSTHIPRTKSELQLNEDTAAAEWRDLCMFHRLVSGIRERQHRQLAIQRQQDDECDRTGAGFKLNLAKLENSASRSPVLQTERCIDSIIRARHNRAPEPEPIVETRMVTPYDSPKVDLRQNQQREGPAAAAVATTAMNLRSVLRQASSIAQETAASEDWSLEGYAGAAPPLSTSNTLEDDDDDDDAIFSLEL